MPRSKILDRGEETAVIFPQTVQVNRRGEKYKVPGEEGRKVRVTVSEDKQAIAELPGQVHVKAVRLLFRWPTHYGDLGVSTRVHFRGEEWDLSVPPHISTGASRAVRHVQLIIKSRNSLGGVLDGPLD